MSKLFLFLFAVLIGGCATTYRQDGLQSSDPSDIAVVEVPPCKNAQCLMIQEVDGKWRGMGMIDRFELMPGRRTLKLVFMAPGVISKNGLLVEFDAMPGRVYTLSTNQNYQTMEWNPELIDATSGVRVGRVVGTAMVY